MLFRVADKDDFIVQVYKGKTFKRNEDGITNMIFLKVTGAFIKPNGIRMNWHMPLSDVKLSRIILSDTNNFQ